MRADKSQVGTANFLNIQTSEQNHLKMFIKLPDFFIHGLNTCKIISTVWHSGWYCIWLQWWGYNKPWPLLVFFNLPRQRSKDATVKRFPLLLTNKERANHRRGLRCHELIQYAYSWYVSMQNNICFPTTCHLSEALCDINGSSRHRELSHKQLWWSLSGLPHAGRVSTVIYM